MQLGINYGNIVLYIIASTFKNKGNVTLIVPKQKTLWDNIGIKKLKINNFDKKVKKIYDYTNFSLNKLIYKKKEI